MKMLLPKSWIQICSFLWCTIMCFGTPAIRIMHTEKREVIVFFNNDSTLMDFSSVPRCESGKKINLVEYSYDQMECVSASADDCSSARYEKLLPEEELVLHEECSLRNKCRTLRFPSRLPTLENKINAMTIKFQCIGQNSAFLDICEKRVLYFNYTLHLILSDHTHFTDCRCWINSWDFTMVLNDVRLTQETGSKCSPAELVINNNRWVCHGRKEDGFGSVFHDKNADISSLGAYVSLVRNSENISPDMVWLVIHPHEISRIECSGDYTNHNHRPATASPTPKTNLVRSTLTPQTTVTPSTETNGEEPDISIGDSTVRKSDVSWVPFFILNIVLLFCLLVLKGIKFIWSRKVSPQQAPQNTVEMAVSSLNNTNSFSSNEKLPERQCRDRLLHRILCNIDYISDQLRIRTVNHPQQAEVFLRRPRKLVSTDMRTSENNLPRRSRKCSSLPNFQDTVTNKASSLCQNFYKSATDVSTGCTWQLSESMRPVTEWNTERNIPSSSRRHLTDESSGDGDETRCFKSYAENTDTLINGKNVELPNLQSPSLDKTTSNETHYTDIKEPIKESYLEKATSTRRCLAATHSCQNQSSFRDYGFWETKIALIGPPSNTDSDEKNSLINNTDDLEETFYDRL